MLRQYEILGSNDGERVDVGLLGRNVVWNCTYRRNTMPPSFSLKIEAVSSFETYIHLQSHTILRYYKRQNQTDNFRRLTAQLCDCYYVSRAISKRYMTAEFA
jgi:hypothetical protein